VFYVFHIVQQHDKFEKKKLKECALSFHLALFLNLRSRGVYIQSYVRDITSFFLDQYVTYCCLIFDPARLGQYLVLTVSEIDSF
jgi:hypothetical protein